MKFILLLALVVTGSLAAPIDDEFELFKSRFNKVYESEEEEQYHKGIFVNTKAYIDQRNAEGSLSYTLGINEFADIDPVIFAKERNGYLNVLNRNNNYTSDFEATGRQVPTSVDWRDKGYVTEVKNQGQCGSCWAFSTTGSLEGQHFKTTGNLVSLSEQDLVDCSKKEGNHGCKGGLMTDAFKYIIKNGGIDTEESYRYKGEDGKCRFKKADIGATCSSYKSIAKKDCSALKEAVATIGPISVAMDASENSFQLYESGIYKPRKCSSTKLDHGVLVVGYGTEDGKDYWIIKNSWGKSWGMKGYFWMGEPEDNLCGICTDASYPIV